MSSRRSKTSDKIAHFLRMIENNGAVGFDGGGGVIKGRPVAYQCTNCGNVPDEYEVGDRCGCGCADFNPISELSN